MTEAIRTCSTPQDLDPADPPDIAETDVVIVGAGFAGLYSIYRFRALGFDVQALELADDVGGTWYWNRYPGARCDVLSFDYCYSFDSELLRTWRWSESYAAQPEILSYAQHVAARHDLKKHIRFSTKVEKISFDQDRDRWMVQTDRGPAVSAQFCVLATGSLSLANVPPFESLDRFDGPVLHTGKWPREAVDFEGKTVGVIGTGSSGIQVIPEIAKTASNLLVFQRTPNYTIPARNKRVEGPPHPRFEGEAYVDYKARALETYSGIEVTDPPIGPSLIGADRDEVEKELERRWRKDSAVLLSSYADIGRNIASNDVVSEFVRRKIGEIVHDPEIADRLMPHFPIGTKRICLDTDYYEAFNRDNVELIDVRQDPITRFSPFTLHTESNEFPLDMLVLATGFDAMTGPLLDLNISGRNGMTLEQEWTDGPKTYLGLTMSGFPNLFTITGPGSPSVRVNMIAAIEQHVDWIAGCLQHMEKNGSVSIEPSEGAQAEWTQHVAHVAAETLLAGAHSWYTGSNIEGKPRVVLPYVRGLNEYTEHCDEIAEDSYRGFEFR